MSTTANSTINIRAPKRARVLIDKAAKVLGRNRSQFVLEVAQEKAKEVLLDRTHFALSEDQHKRFMRALDKPLPQQSVDALKRMLARKAPWES